MIDLDGLDFSAMELAMARFGDAAGELMQVVASCAQIVDVLGPAMVTVWETVWAAYREAGMPYGENDEGVHRWLRDVGEIGRLRMEAERMEAHHRDMVAFRRMVERRML